jgi:hypothetical protein
MRALLHACAAVLVLAGAGAARAAELPADHDVKAALLFKFLQFVEWPAPKPRVQLCVVGRTPIYESAVALRARSAPPVTVRRAAASDLGGCDVVLVAASEHWRVETLAAELGPAGVLVVGDGPQFAARGAHLNFYVEADRVRFEANVRAIRRDPVHVSSKLLRLARLVEGAP